MTCFAQSNYCCVPPHMHNCSAVWSNVIALAGISSAGAFLHSCRLVNASSVSRSCRPYRGKSKFCAWQCFQRFCILFQGGLGQAAATVAHLLNDFNGLEACRHFYGTLLKLPAAGGSFFHGILGIELSQQTDRLPDSKLKVIFEVPPLMICRIFIRHCRNSTELLDRPSDECPIPEKICAISGHRQGMLSKAASFHSQLCYVVPEKYQDLLCSCDLLAVGSCGGLWQARCSFMDTLCAI